MKRKIRITTYLDKETEGVLKRLIEHENSTGKHKSKSKVVRNAIRTYYNYLEYQKRRGEI